MFCGLAITAGKAEAFDFELSAGRLGEDSIFDSSWATPARYLHEICRRLLRQRPGARVLAVGNPILPLRSATLSKWCEGLTEAPAIISDTGGFPCAFLIPASLFDQGADRFLPLLSMLDADLDGQLLQAAGGVAAVRERLAIPAVAFVHGASYAGPFLLWDDKMLAWKEQCRAAIRLLQQPGGRAAPAALYLPFYAGDVLFAALASRYVETPLYRRILVQECYRDIWARAGGRLDMVGLPQARPGRFVFAQEGLVFAAEAAKVGSEYQCFLGFGRSSRGYHRSAFHLVDHARFALGDSLLSAGELFHCQAPPPVRPCRRPARPLHVLLCLDGSWALKCYPARDRAILIEVLQRLGCRVSVLNREGGGDDGAVTVRSRSTEELSALLADHHVFVGVDTFDLHFARHIAGHPTVSLFGSTWPGHSDSARSEASRVLCGPLACNPCTHSDRCAQTGGSDCRNYPSPHEIVAAVLDTAHHWYPVESAS